MTTINRNTHKTKQLWETNPLWKCCLLKGKTHLSLQCICLAYTQTNMQKPPWHRSVLFHIWPLKSTLPLVAFSGLPAPFFLQLWQFAYFPHPGSQSKHCCASNQGKQDLSLPSDFNYNFAQLSIINSQVCLPVLHTSTLLIVLYFFLPVIMQRLLFSYIRRL